jgi:hypothetical protein
MHGGHDLLSLAHDSVAGTATGVQASARLACAFWHFSQKIISRLLLLAALSAVFLWSGVISHLYAGEGGRSLSFCAIWQYFSRIRFRITQRIQS